MSSETVVGAGGIAFERCRTGSNSLLDAGPRPSGIHCRPFRSLPRKGGPDAHRCGLSLLQLGIRLLEHFLDEGLSLPVAFTPESSG